MAKLLDVNAGDLENNLENLKNLSGELEIRSVLRKIVPNYKLL